MSYGFLARTGNGEVVVDADRPNFRPFKIGSRGSTSSLGTTTINHRSEPRTPLLFAHPFDTWVSFEKASASYDQATVWETAGSGWDYVFTDEQGSVLVNPSSWGMEIRDAAGDLVLNSDERLMVVRDVVTTAPVDQDETKTHTLSHASVTKPYYLLSPLQGMIGVKDIETPPSPTLRPFFRNASTTSMEYKWVQIGSADHAEGWDARPLQWIVVVAELTG